MESEILFGIYNFFKKLRMKKYSIVLFSLIVLFTSVNAQTDEQIYESDRQAAFAQIMGLKDSGAIVLRLILHKKNADLYRQAGNTKLADKLEKDLRLSNKTLALSFLDESFNFCPVYVIESADYGRVLNGQESGYFLDKNLNIDSSIVMKEKYFLFIDIGSVYEVVRKDDSFLKSEVTSTPVIQNALVFKDKNLQQLFKPFPNSVPLDGVYLDFTNLVVYQKGKKEDDLVFRSLEEYANYIKNKYNLSKKQVSVAQKIFNLNVRLFGFHTNAHNASLKD